MFTGIVILSAIAALSLSKMSPIKQRSNSLKLHPAASSFTAEAKNGVLTAHAWYFFSYSLKKQGHTHNLTPVRAVYRSVNDANGWICRTLFVMLIANLLLQKL